MEYKFIYLFKIYSSWLFHNQRANSVFIVKNKYNLNIIQHNINICKYKQMQKTATICTGFS